MSITKRMWGAGVTVSPECRAEAVRERREHLASFFKVLRPQHHAYVKARMRPKRADVYRMLYPHGRPSSSKFYRDVKRAGGLSAYLTHCFHSNTRACLETLGLPPEQVRKLIGSVADGSRYMLTLEDAGAYAPGDEEIRESETIKAKPRRFRHASLPSMMTDRSIHEFFTDVYKGNEPFYIQHPDALFRADLLDYADYLQSPFWFVIRNIVLYRDGFKCRICTAKATTVHHISYEPDVLYGWKLEPLVSLCDPCHERIEFDDEGNKISDLEVKRVRYEALRREATEQT